MKKFKKNMVEKWEDYVVVLLMSISILFLLQDIVDVLPISDFYAPYIIVLPIMIIVVILKLYCRSKKVTVILEKISYAAWLAIIEYLGFLLFKFSQFSPEIKVFVYMITTICLLLHSREKKNMGGEGLEVANKDNEKEIFSLYYINIDKVYEIAMLLNNKIITGGTNENEIESSLKEQANFGINTNISYLETVKGELGISQETQTYNAIKNKVLENFDVKTTKSNMLASIIAKAKIYKEDAAVGDLVLLKNATLRLLNEAESYAVTKMILNGAFKNTKISSHSDEMKIELDLSAMINSVLKDCAYELGCVVENKKFLLTIPMTFENDFESSYNIYDLQVGKVTVVGIYRGKRQYERRLSLQEIFSENNGVYKKTYENTDYELEGSNVIEAINIDNIENDGNHLNNYQEVIDVIAVIQEINAK